jgi:hypothetical protein
VAHVRSLRAGLNLFANRRYARIDPVSDHKRARKRFQKPLITRWKLQTYHGLAVNANGGNVKMHVLSGEKLDKTDAS